MTPALTSPEELRAQIMGITIEELRARAEAFWSQQVDTGPLLPGELPTQQQGEISMTEIQGRKLTMTFSKTRQVKQYEPEVVSATMEVDLPPGTTVAEAQAVFTDEYAVLKGEVYKQHGIATTWDPNEKLVMEAFGAGDAATVQNTPQAPQAPAQLQAVPNQPAPAQQMAPPQMPAPQQADPNNPFNPGAPAQQAAPASDQGSVPHWDSILFDIQNTTGMVYDQETGVGNLAMANWYDNRNGKRNPKGPDFKSKSIPQPDNPQYKLGLWLRDCPAHIKAQLG